MTRIVSYNILAGGYNLRDNSRRTVQLTKIIRSAQPDIVGLIEGLRGGKQEQPIVAEEIAENLGMQLIKGASPVRIQDYQLALLTRLPVVYTKVHARPGKLLRALLEVCVETGNGETLTVFVTHLSAAFNQGRAGGHIRMREIKEIVRIMAPLRASGQPHLLMGDFNSLAPGDAFKGSAVLRCVVQQDSQRSDVNLHDGNPYLDSIVPSHLLFLAPILRMVAKSQLLCNLFDTAVNYYAPRGCIRFLKEVGYVDSYRLQHPHSAGFTCLATAPAGRIDYIFASPGLAEQLVTCEVITETQGLPGHQASDHLALQAEFGLGAVPFTLPEKLDNTLTNRVR